MHPRLRGSRSCIRLAISLLTLALFASGCAKRRAVVVPTAPAAPPPTRDIEGLIERGCFRCLEQALALAEERGHTRLAFEAASLLAVRATELGMPSESWMTRARTLAAAEPTWAPYLEMAAAIPPDPLRGVRDDLLVMNQGRNRARSLLPAWHETLQTGSLSLPFRRYLELTLTCRLDETAPATRMERLTALASALPDLPLLTYRLGSCDDRFQPQLAAVQSDPSGFVDADYMLGWYALRDSKAPDPDAAMRRFRTAAAAFPSSTSIPTAIGNLYQTWEDWTNALAAYDAALALLPSHPDAQIGRVISLSRLERHEEAIAAATRLIEGGQWHLGQAFYWRAWNHYNIGNNPAARSDADRTRTLMVNAGVFLLSGLIEWRFVHREPAENEFQEALKMDFGQCEAAFYLGGVRYELRKLAEALAAMNQAQQCYDLTLAVRRKLLAETLAGPGTPESKARDVARHERSIASAVKRREEVLASIDRVQRAQNPAAPVAPISRPAPRGR
jgi:tetratricopeptide (TPR) repeat protein